MPLLLTVLLASAATMASAAAQANGLMSAAAAALFAIALTAAALRVNVPLWSLEDETAEDADLEALVVRRNAGLAAVLYGWGAAAMLAIYTLSGLYWRHGWQYGAAMALVAAGLLLYTDHINVVGSALRSPRGLRVAWVLTLVHGGAAALVLIWLLVSGKVASPRGDWAANHVFVAGTITLVALCLIAAATQRRLQGR